MIFVVTSALDSRRFSDRTKKRDRQSLSLRFHIPGFPYFNRIIFRESENSELVRR